MERNRGYHLVTRFHGELGEPIATLCQTTGHHLPRLHDLIRAIATAYTHMPSGIVHGDANNQNFGWRRTIHELVLFDLHKIALGPRFLDVASRIWATDPPPPTDHTRGQWAQYYLDHYHHFGGAAIPLTQFLTETKVLWLGGIFSILSYQLQLSLSGQVDWTSDRAEGKRIYRNWLHQNLSTLLQQTPETLLEITLPADK